MKINPSIFKAYDIRGIYPADLDEETANLLGQALVVFLAKKRPKIVVSADNRLSSPGLKKNLIRGILTQGGHVIDIGLATTPIMYFTVANFGYDGGVEVTSSHNPPQYNGFKIVGRGSRPIGEKSGLLEIKKLVFAENFAKKKKGRIARKNILSDYLRFNLRNFDFEGKRRLRIAIDSSNAVAGILTPHLKKELPFEIFPLFEKLDGRFPNHNPDPLKEENLKALCRKVIEKKLDFGAAFDGDGDRIIFVDEKGKIITSDLVASLLSLELLEKHPGAKIVYDIRSSNILPETIKNGGGVPLLERIGHSFIKARMRKEKAVFGSELSGHFYCQKHYFCECPIFVLLKVAEMVLSQEKPLSRLVAPFEKYYNSGEINFEVRNKEKSLKEIERKIGRKGRILKIDGLRMDFKDWWFLVRPSNTEPVIRLVVEARNRKILRQKTHILSGILHG